MAIENDEPEVKFIERHEVAPAEGENIDENPDSSQDEEKDETEEDTSKKEDESNSKETEEETKAEEAEEDSKESDTAEVDNPSTENEKYGDVKPIAGETPREFALRIENARLRSNLRKDQTKDIMVAPPEQQKQELSPEKKKILEKYKPADIETLKEVFGVMADDMGFVKKDQLNTSTYQEKATEILDDFLEKHPEYQPQNDKGSILWNRFKEEFSIYKPPANARALKQILNKVHTEVFGIKPAASLNKNEAAKEKITVASHSGSSRPAPSREGVKRQVVSQGLRTDMLKGFSEEEIAELTG